MDQSFRRYWIFQGMPDRYDLGEELVPGNTEPWVLSKYREAVNVGDIVYFWRGGRQPGFWGWGFIVEPPQSGFSKANSDDVRVPVLYQERFRSPLSKNELISLDEESGNLSGLMILRSPQGTNFKVTTNEAIYLNQLLERRGDVPPPFPTGTDSGEFPGQSLLPLAFSTSVTRVVGAALRAATAALRDDELFETLIALTQSNHAPSRGVTSLLGDVFGYAIRQVLLDAIEDPLALSRDDLVEAGVDRVTLDILEAARLLAIGSTARESISARHLFGGMLLAGSDRLLNSIAEGCQHTTGQSLREFVDTYADFVVRTFPKDDSSSWLNRWAPAVQARIPERPLDLSADDVETGTEVSQPTLTVDQGTEDTRARAFARAFAGRPLTDRPTGHDLLKIDNEVKALAHLFAQASEPAATGTSDTDARRPTFALGLFGRWGAGKSFFIRKLQRKIDELSEKGSDDGQTYYTNIVQIDFNAWHYNEADIWASLVHHIFDTLQKRFAEQKQEAQFKKLISELESSQIRRQEIKARLKTKQSERNRISRAIGRKEADIEKNVSDQMAKISGLGQIAASPDLRKKFSTMMPDAANLLGLPGDKLNSSLATTGKSAQELLDLLQESGALAAKSHSAGRSILQSALSPWLIGTLAVVVVIYAAVPELTGNDRYWHDFAVPLVGQAVTVITPVLLWIRRNLTKANALMDQVTGMEATLRDEIRRQEETSDEALKTLRIDHARIEKDIEQGRDRLEAVDLDIRDIEAQLAELGSPESLLDFINDRASSDDYRKQLGILALIRSDFEKLSDLMTSNEQRRKSGNGVDLPKLDRIILYIDDLDRVQETEKVLQVLEAVHLLLAFPLFHVVLAVDERWAARSVQHHHSAFFQSLALSNGAQGDGDLPKQDLTTRPATPREFLEKIFQICFWVRPLTAQLSNELIEGTVRGDTTETAANAGTSQGASNEEDAEQSDEGRDSTAEDPADTDIDNAADQEPDSAPNDIANAGTGEDLGDDLGEPEESGGSEDAGRDDSARSTHVDFSVSEEELISMRALSRVIGRSPRTTKRFINTYKLFKGMRIPPGTGATTSDPLSPLEMAENHVPIMILLSIQIGHPDVAFQLFAAFDEALEDDDSQTLGQVLNSPYVPSDADSRKWHTAIDSLKSVQDLWGETTQLVDLPIASLDDWLLGTSRFGFKEWVPAAERLWGPNEVDLIET